MAYAEQDLYGLLPGFEFESEIGTGVSFDLVSDMPILEAGTHAVSTRCFRPELMLVTATLPVCPLCFQGPEMLNRGSAHKA